MTKKAVDNLIEQLYSSNDPLCFEAAKQLQQKTKSDERLNKRLEEITLAAKYMLESLMEINSLSCERDDRIHKDYKSLSKELNLRLLECGDIAKDTLNLKTVKKAYERMYYE